MNAWPGWLIALACLAVIVASVLPSLLLHVGGEWWATRRAQRAWDRGEAERQRRWAEEDRREAVRRQLQELEEQIREEQRSDEERAWRQQYREREAAITREARRRLGLPDEEEPPA